MSDATLHDVMVEQTQAAQQLLDFFQGVRGDLEARMDAAVAQAGDTLRTLYVDQANGDDANEGTLASPLASLMEANNRSVWAGVTWVNLIGDYEMRHRFTVRPHALVIEADGGTFSIAADSLNAPGNQPGFVCNRGSMPDVSVTFDNLTLDLPESADTEGLFINTGFVRLALKAVDITLGGATTRTICSGSGSIGIVTSSVTFPAGMAGRWVESVGAGETPSTARRVAYSSLATL